MLILLVGQSGSGKSTAASILCEEFKLKEETFAAPLKEIAMTLGFERQEVYGTQEEKLAPNRHWGVSGREFMQKFGTEICRDALPALIPNMRNVWIRLMEKKIKKNPHIVISDGRFPDEVAMVQRCGGVVIQINRNLPRMTHASEQQYLQSHYQIDNNGTLAEFKKELIDFPIEPLEHKYLRLMNL